MNFSLNRAARSAVAGAVLALGSWLPAQAALMLVDDATFGADAVVQDTVNGKDWLRLDFTQLKTYDFVAAQLGAGGAFEGWSIGTKALLEDLGLDNGIVHDETSAAGLTQARAFRDMICFSCVQTSSTHIYARGLVADVLVDPDPLYNGLPLAFTVGEKLSPSSVDFRTSGFGARQGADSIWLYRDAGPGHAVPEPHSLALMGAGLAALLLRRRRKAG